MEQSKTLKILSIILSNNEDQKVQGYYKGNMVYNNELKALLFEVEDDVYDNYKIIFHPSGGQTPSDIVSEFNSPFSEPYNFKLHYSVDGYAENIEDYTDYILEIGQSLVHPKSVFDCDLSDFNYFVSFLNSSKSSEFLNQVRQAVLSIEIGDNNEYLDYLKENGVNIEKFFEGKATKQDIEYNQSILQKFHKELFDSPDNVLPKLKIIRDNIMAYLAFSNISSLKSSLDKLPIQNIQEIKEYITGNPELIKSINNSFLNNKSDFGLKR